MKPLFDHTTIQELIPQREPMVEVDTFYGIEDDVAWAGLTITPENIFTQDDHFTTEGLMEHMAQSAAARAGYVALKDQQPVALGYIGAVNKAEFGRLPRVGERLLTRVEVIQEVMDITLIEVECRVEEEMVAKCRMKIFTERRDDQETK